MQTFFVLSVESLYISDVFFTPFRIEDAQYATPSPLITAHKVGGLNEKRCKRMIIRAVMKS